MPTPRRDVFQAIADPTRRDIIRIISTQSLTVSALASNFGISRPAISQQLKILEECGLLNFREEGRERICEARLEKLKEVSAWVEHYSKFWTKKLMDLENFLGSEELKQKPKSSGRISRAKKKNHG